MKITLFLRKKGAGFSLDDIFKNLYEYLVTTTPIINIEMPENRITILGLLKNIVYAKRNKSEVNHICGDVHYLTFGLPSNNTILTVADCVMLHKYSKTNFKYWFYFIFWYKLPCAKAKVIVAISDKSKAELIQLMGVPESKIKVIPPSYNQLFDRPKQVNEYHHSELPVILVIGTAEHKNIERLIYAIKDIPCVLEIIGEIPENIRALLLKYRIGFRSYKNLSIDEVIQRYLNATLVSFVSTYEGFGMPIIEAQALKKPVVTSNISPMLEVSGGGACLVDPFDVADIKRGILQVLNNEDYRSLIIDKGTINKVKYSIELVAKEYLEIYKSVVL
jgi:glycosyltransferase involved in cell wall biosynthesis